jgi:hypothetical protein
MTLIDQSLRFLLFDDNSDSLNRRSHFPDVYKTIDEVAGIFSTPMEFVRLIR